MILYNKLIRMAFIEWGSIMIMDQLNGFQVINSLQDNLIQIEVALKNKTMSHDSARKHVKQILTVTEELDKMGYNKFTAGIKDIAKNILYTAFNLVDLKDMTENEMIAVSRNIYLMSSEMQKDLRGVKTVGRMCNIISLTPDSVKVKFIEN